MKKREIENAYDAYWFLLGHPKLNVQERHEVTPEEANELENKGFHITRDPCGRCYRVWRHLFKHALECNLDIFYAKTDKPGGHGTVSADKSKNLYVECWLEFGPIQYGFSYSGNSRPMAEWDDTTVLIYTHDYRLDTGGSTFDEGLINLAKNVQKYYGNYSDKLTKSRSRWCGKPVCGDCNSLKCFKLRDHNNSG